MDEFWNKLEGLNKRVETRRAGPFVFQIGIDPAASKLPYYRVADAQARFRVAPFAQVANDLEREVEVRSVFGTNTIEGGELSETETARALELIPEEVQSFQQRRVRNIKSAYDYMRKIAREPDWALSLDEVVEIHRLICGGLEDSGEDCQAGVLRDNPKGMVTQVGNPEHGGVYKPPQFGRDVRALLQASLEWNAELAAAGIPALLRAPLLHLYFELIHPFWDGNGRVGRVLEAAVLHADGFRYAPFAQANFYLRNIHQYFALFNQSRKAAKARQSFPNHAFVEFFLHGMLETINHLHDRVNRLIHIVLFQAHARQLQDRRVINPREYAVVDGLLRHGRPLSLDELRALPWYRMMYARLSPQTRMRDLNRLKSLRLVLMDEQQRLRPGVFG